MSRNSLNISSALSVGAKHKCSQINKQPDEGKGVDRKGGKKENKFDTTEESPAI